MDQTSPVNQPAQYQQTPPSSPSRKSLAIPLFILSVLLLSGAIVGAAFLSKNFALLQRFLKASPSPAQQSLTPLPTTQPAGTFSLEKCSVTKEGSPLVDYLKTLPVGTESVEQNMTVGSLRGNINKLTYDAKAQTAIVELISPKGEQTHTLNLKEEPSLVHDATTVKDMTLADLKVGQTAVVSFNCLPDNQDKQFRVTRVAITGK